jgi:hypothetical protein
MTDFLAMLIEISEKEKPQFLGRAAYRPFPEKHTRLKVYSENSRRGKYRIAVKVETPDSRRSKFPVNYYEKQYVPLGNPLDQRSWFNTEEEAVEAAKEVLDWLKEPLKDAELFDRNGEPCDDIQTARFALKKSRNDEWVVKDLDERYYIDGIREETREEAIRKMKIFGTDIGEVLLCE